MRTCELAVVGAGPGGMAAGIAASAAGVATILLDSQPQPGGQYYRAPAGEPVERRATQRAAAMARLVDARVDIINHTLVWGMFPDSTGAGWQLAVDTPSGPEAITAEAVILAPGAYDRPIPFPGWTLPGVLTAGAVETLLKGSRVFARQAGVAVGNRSAANRCGGGAGAGRRRGGRRAGGRAHHVARRATSCCAAGSGSTHH